MASLCEKMHPNVLAYAEGNTAIRALGEKGLSCFHELFDESGDFLVYGLFTGVCSTRKTVAQKIKCHFYSSHPYQLKKEGSGVIYVKRGCEHVNEAFTSERSGEGAARHIRDLQSSGDTKIYAIPLVSSKSLQYVEQLEGLMIDVLGPCANINRGALAPPKCGARINFEMGAVLVGKVLYDCFSSLTEDKLAEYKVAFQPYIDKHGYSNSPKNASSPKDLGSTSNDISLKNGTNDELAVVKKALSDAKRKLKEKTDEVEELKLKCAKLERSIDKKDSRIRTLQLQVDELRYEGY